MDRCLVPDQDVNLPNQQDLAPLNQNDKRLLTTLSKIAAAQSTSESPELEPALRIIGPSFFLDCARRCLVSNADFTANEPAVVRSALPLLAAVKTESTNDADAAHAADAADASAFLPLAKDAALAASLRLGLGRELLRRLPHVTPPQGEEPDDYQA